MRLPDDEFERAAGCSISWEGLDVFVGPKHVLASSFGSVAAGKFCAILGPSGAGKTTLLNALAGRASSKGKVLFGGRMLDTESLRQFTG